MSPPFHTSSWHRTKHFLTPNVHHNTVLSPNTFSAMTMRAILPTTSASVHPDGPLPDPSQSSRRGAELPVRSRWFERVGDFFFGAPSSGINTPAPHLAGADDQVTTTEETPEEPIIRWFCAFDFKRGEDNEALVADGWRWRVQIFLATCVMIGAGWGVLAMLVLPRWVNGVVPVMCVAVAAVATVLAFFQNSSRLRRCTAATMLHAIFHLALLATCVCTLLTDTDWDWVLSSPNASSIDGGALSPALSRRVDAWRDGVPFDAWIRREITLSVCASAYFCALLLPESRTGRWLGIAFQVVAVPAIQVRGERGGDVEAGRAAGWLD